MTDHILGQTIGSYRITGKLSEGGMGVVYRAEHSLLGRAAAVKLLLPMYSQEREIVQRFFTEARVTSSIRHPGIVEVFDFGYHDDGRAFLIMELLGGEPLSRRLARLERLDEAAAIGFVRSVVGALGAAHARGVVHRDLKPDNIFLVPDPDVSGGERPKLLDFGIAKLADVHASTGATRTGAVLGTPAYMSPEQCRGTGAIDARSDLYALGCILYQCVSGRTPFVAEGTGELIAAHLYFEPTPLRDVAPWVSPQLDAIVARLLAKDPAHRFATALDLGAQLAELQVSGAERSGWAVVSPTPYPTPTTPTTLGGATGVTVTRAATRKRASIAVAVGMVGAAAVAFAVFRPSAATVADQAAFGAPPPPGATARVIAGDATISVDAAIAAETPITIDATVAMLADAAFAIAPDAVAAPVRTVRPQPPRRVQHRSEPTSPVPADAAEPVLIDDLNPARKP